MKITSFPLGPIGTNCYLAYDGAGNAAIVDPGDEPEVVERQLSALGLTPKAIFLTHGHFDHTTAVPALVEAHPGLPVYIHKGDASEGGGAAQYRFAPVPGTVYYDQGDEITVGEMTFRVLHTPGHSPGSVVLQSPGVLFTGDTLFRGSMGRTDLPGGSYAEIMESLARLGKLEGDYQVFPGHMDSSTLETERRSNYYLREALAP